MDVVKNEQAHVSQASTYLAPAVESNPDLAACIAKLDRAMSEMKVFSQETRLDRADQRTLKHHAEDLILCGVSVLRDLGIDEAKIAALFKVHVE